MTSKLLIVDDEPQNLQLMRQLLSQDYQLVFATDGQKALEAVAKHSPDLILMDVMMPRMDGYQACRMLKEDARHRHIPVIFVTAMSEARDEAEGFDAGGVDYITKPIQAPAVKRRVKNHLAFRRVEELKNIQLQIVRGLGRSAEFKTNESGRHAIRMSYYAEMMAEKMGRPPEWRQLIFQAAPMHDVGKAAMPDQILLKTGPLDEEDWRIIRTHPRIGADIIGQHQTGLLAMAREITLYHHEKWDGTGYPEGLSGENIPLSSRIVTVADVMDAVTHQRPYQPAWPLSQALNLLRAEAGAHFDPDLAELFLSIQDDVISVQEKWPDHD